MIKSYALILLVFCYTVVVNGQIIPPVENYTVENYKAENQNWAISQASNRNIYVSNNKGLLEYNGTSWKLYDSPNNTILRSVLAIDDQVYTGAYMDFGLWSPNELGDLEYQSLANPNFDFIEDEQIWNILNLDEFIVFQSLQRIFIYNITDHTFNIVSPKEAIVKMYKVGSEVYFQQANKGLYKIEAGKVSLVTNDNVIINSTIINVFKRNDDLILVTASNGLYRFDKTEILPYETPISAQLSNFNVYSSIQTSAGNLVLGTIANGIWVLSNDNELLYTIDKDSGLGDNTVLNVFEDIDLNLWLALDNGIDCINSNSAFRIYNDAKGRLGTVYTSIVYDNNLYLGTNQGLFTKELNSGDEFKFVRGTEGQVWTLEIIDSQLFCGHNSGTFLINDNESKLISSIQGTWQFSLVENQENLIIQGNYDGLHILERQNENWVYRNKIKGFNNSSKHFAFASDNVILVNHEYKGIFNVKVDENYREVISFYKDSLIDKGAYSSLIKYEGSVLYGSEEGVFKYDINEARFIKDEELSPLLNTSKFTSGKLVYDKPTQTLWGFSANSVSYMKTGGLTTNKELNRVSLPIEKRNHLSGYENLSSIADDKFIIGTSSGFLSLNLQSLSERPYTLKISSIKNSDRLGSKTEKVSLHAEGEFKPKQNTLVFNYGIVEFDAFTKPLYQYQLVGLSNDWSSWTTNTSERFENLSYGDYTFKVRGKSGNSIVGEDSYSFTINKPWYLSNLTVIIYVIALILLLLGIDRLYRKRQAKALSQTKRELSIKELENKQQQMSFENESLKKDMEMKSKEVAISTMSLIKKNEFLNKIKKELTDLKTEANIKPIIRIIDKNISNTDDWKFFEDAFNNADKDFLKTIKAKHPSLTPNDLKLCAYLRLNLSSKEIAPLLNISPRSVEVKRYRLRKKIDLSREDSLTNYILEI